MTDLPQSGPERQMLLRALRFYSDTCEPPNLHPECPFAVPTPTGFGCGEECMDVLGACEDPQASQGIDFVRLARPRARRVAFGSDKPFDANEIKLADADLPLQKRRPTALLLELMDLMFEPPPLVSSSSRQRTFDHLASELYHRGFDVEELITEAIVPSMAASIAFLTLLPTVIAAAGEAVPGDWSYSARAGWQDLLFDDGLKVEERAKEAAAGIITPADAMDRTLGSVPKIVAWLLAQPPLSLIDWPTPTPEEYRLVEPVPLPEPGRHVWVVDRFTTTYLAEWHTSSLHFEYRYQTGAAAVPPCVATEMRRRQVPAIDIAIEVAARATGTRHGPQHAAPAQKYVGLAVDMLKNGSRSAAAAIFDAAHQASPLDPMAMNNRGFCLLPDAPAQALQDLERAAELGFRSHGHNLANRMLALLYLNRHTTALAVAEEEWPSSDYTGAWLWDFRSAEPTVVYVADVAIYVVDLAAHIADAAGDPVDRERWLARRARD